MPVDLRTHTHEERESLAREISKKILSKYGDSVLSIFICGSTAKKLDRPYSDLEIMTVIRDSSDIATVSLDTPVLSFPPTYYLHNGIIIQIDYVHESGFLQAARRVTLNWPFEADQYRNRIVLFEREGWLKKLDDAASQIDESEMREALRASTVQTIEDLSYLRNAELSNNMAAVRAGGLYMASDICKVVLLMNRRYVLTTSWFWKQAFECLVKPERLQELVEKMAGFVPTSTDEIIHAAEKLSEAVVNMVKDQGVSIESRELVI